MACDTQGERVGYSPHVTRVALLANRINVSLSLSLWKGTIASIHSALSLHLRRSQEWRADCRVKEILHFSRGECRERRALRISR